MNKRNVSRMIGSGAALAAVAILGLMLTSGQSRADNDNNPPQDEKQKIEIGAKITPVHLNMSHKDASTVYLGSYIVNAMGGCNDCHTNPSYTATGDPYKGQPKAFNAAKYLGGGATFGPFTSRNITPDATGKPAGLSYSDFVQVIRTGKDFDHQHGANVPLQVMPWPVYQSMTDRDLAAIYAYLSAIPCLEGDPGIVPPAAGPRCH